MTIAQIITVLLAGPIGLICFLKLFVTAVFKEFKDFGIMESILLVFCTVAIVVSFVGISWRI